MDFERSLLGKMQLWMVQHFFLHKKIPVLMDHNIWKNCMLWFITTCIFLWRKTSSTIHSCIFSEVTAYKIHTLKSDLESDDCKLNFEWRNVEVLWVNQIVLETIRPQNLGLIKWNQLILNIWCSDSNLVLHYQITTAISTAKIWDILTKLQKSSVFPWRYNRHTNSKSTKFIWVIVILILYNFYHRPRHESSNISKSNELCCFWRWSPCDWMA